MTKFLLPILAAATVCAVLPAHAETAGRTITFESDGVRYEAREIQAADGTRTIVGKDLSHNTPFELHVANGQVDGVVGRQSVSYAVPKAGSVSYRNIALTTEK